MQKLFRVLVVTVLLSLFILWFATYDRLCWDFRNNLWGPAYLLLHGQSAYRILLLFSGSNSIWFPQIIGVFFPLGLLPQRLATNAWLVLNIALLFAIIWFIHQEVAHKKPNPLFLACLLITALLFPPTIRLFQLGQVDILLVGAVMAGTYALRNRRISMAGFFFAAAAVKPQLCVFPLIGAIGYLWRLRSNWRDPLSLFGWLCGWSLLLTIPLWIGNPGWITDLVINLLNNPQWDQPSVFSILTTSFGQVGFALWLLLLALGLVVNHHLWEKRGLSEAVYWSLALSAILSPYLWSWDFVLLLPLLLHTIIRISRPLARVLLFSVLAAGFVFSILLLQAAHYNDKALWWLPFLMIAGILGSIWVNSHQAKAAW